MGENSREMQVEKTHPHSHQQPTAILDAQWNKMLNTIVLLLVNVTSVSHLQKAELRHN